MSEQTPEPPADEQSPPHEPLTIETQQVDEIKRSDEPETYETRDLGQPGRS